MNKQFRSLCGKTAKQMIQNKKTHREPNEQKKVLICAYIWETWGVSKHQSNRQVRQPNLATRALISYEHEACITKQQSFEMNVKNGTTISGPRKVIRNNVNGNVQQQWKCHTITTIMTTTTAIAATRTTTTTAQPKHKVTVNSIIGQLINVRGNRQHDKNYQLWLLNDDHGSENKVYH